MRPSFARSVITRLRYPRINDHGNTIVDTGATPTETPIEGCWLEPIAPTEDNLGRSARTTGYTVDAPPGIDITTDDRVRYGGIVFDVAAPPLIISSPTGALNSTQITLILREG